MESNHNQDSASLPPTDGSNPSATTPPPLPTIRLPQPFKILVDIWGVLTSNHFRADLYHYLDEHLEEYLREHLHSADLTAYLQALVHRNIEDRERYPQLPIIGLADCCDNTESRVKSIVENIRLRRTLGDARLKVGLDGLFNMVWLDGYRRKTLHPHVFPDVLTTFPRWITEPYYIKIHSFASGSSENQKLFLSATSAGDVSQYITSGIDAHGSYKYDPAKYRSILSTLGERIPGNLLFITDSPRKADAAKKAGLSVFIIRREGNRRLKEAEVQAFTVIDSLEQLEFIPAQ